MADWFKFYNDGLDSGGLQYCISEQPLSVSVWVLILTEASKNRSGKIPWDDKEFRLLGLARKINISPAIFNQCVTLLEHCGYLVRRKGFIDIPSWNKFQSDYAKGLEKGYYKKTRKKLASHSEVSTTRGEERRLEESINTLPEGFPADPKSAVAHAAFVACPDQFALDVWNDAMGRGGRDGADVPIRNWRFYLTKRFRIYQAEHAKSNGHAVHQNGNF